MVLFGYAMRSIGNSFHHQLTIIASTLLRQRSLRLVGVICVNQSQSLKGTELLEIPLAPSVS